MLKVVSDILLALDSSNLSILALLDLSAAFDSTLLQRFRISYGIDGTVLDWYTIEGILKHAEFPELHKP